MTVCLTGAFSTANQARNDKNFRDLTLHVVPIWTERTDGPWLYCEQSLTDVPDHPYRQRIYRLVTRSDNTIACQIYDVPNPVALTGAWKDTSLLATLTPASLGSQAGCTLILRLQPDGSYKGGTEGKACLSTMRGASYATTEITVDGKQTILWERGYNAGDTQVWGSTQGGYIFEKLAADQPPAP